MSKQGTVINKQRVPIVKYPQHLSQFLKDPLNALASMIEHYGDFFYIDWGFVQQYVTTNPEIAHEVLVSKAEHFHKMRSRSGTPRGIRRFIGDTLLNTNGAEHQYRRSLVTPTLHRERIKNYAASMVSMTSQHIQTWNNHSQRDIAKDMKRLTLGIAAETLFGVELSADIERIGALSEAGQRINGPSIFLTNLLPNWIPPLPQPELLAYKAEIDGILDRMIEERLPVADQYNDMLSNLLADYHEDGGGLSKSQIRDDIITLFIGGHETSANALTWLWYRLAQNPEVQARLHEELDRVLEGRIPTYEDIPNLPYTDQVIKETLRLYPSIWTIVRHTANDLELGGHPIAAGSDVAVLLYFMQRDEKWFSNAAEFQPERFNSECESRRRKGVYMPFGGGPRVCIGTHFAILEAQLIVATIASQFHFQIDADIHIDIEPRVTLNPAKPVCLTVTKRS